MIQFKCSSCGAQLESPESCGNGTDTCPLCKTTVRVPPSREQLAEAKQRKRMERDHQKQLEAQRRQEQQRQQQAEQQWQIQAARDREQAFVDRKNRIIISTGSISQEHTILQIVFAAGIQKFGGAGIFKKGLMYITDGEYNQMLEQVYVAALEIFKHKGAQIGADAIIHAKFDIEQITLSEAGLVSAGEALRIQVFCTGTAVKFVNSQA